MKMRRYVAAASLGAVLFVTTVGCFDTHLKSCAIYCGAQGQCPSGFACSAGLCAGSGEVCRGVTDGGVDIDTRGADAEAGRDARSDLKASVESGVDSADADTKLADASLDSNPDTVDGDGAPRVNVDGSNAAADVDTGLPSPTGWWAMQPGMRANSTSTHGPAAFARSDGNSTIVYGDAEDHISDLLFDGARWRVGDLSSSPDIPKTASPVAVFVQGDGTSTVAYRTPANSIEILSQGPGATGWHADNLCSGADGSQPALDGSAPTESPQAAGSPYGYVRFDQISAIVFRDIAGSLYELSRSKDAHCWSLSNLQGKADSPIAVGDPMGFVRADRTNSVVYVSADGHIQELSMAATASTWKSNDLMSSFPSGQAPPDAAGPPRGYVRNDGSTAIMYRTDTGLVWELSRIYGTLPTSTSWFSGEPGPDGAPAVSDPAPYVRADGQSTIVYTDGNGQIWEIGKTAGWPYWSPASEISVAATPPAAEGPVGYVRGDGTTAVVFHDAQGHIWQLELSGTPPHWSVGDVTAASTAP